MGFLLYIVSACGLVYAIWPLDTGNYVLALACAVLMTVGARLNKGWN